MSDRLLQRFSPYLKEGETILWLGGPKQGFFLRDADIILIPFSIILVGFSAIIDYIIITYRAPVSYQIIGLMFAGAGIYMAGIRFVRDYFRRKYTCYCITNRRVLKLSGRRSKLFTLPLRNISHLDKNEEKDGSGFIFFGNTNPLWPWLFGKFYFTSHPLPGLELIPEVDKVYQLLRRQINTEIASPLREEAEQLQRQAAN
ncbi:MAG: hypothetical protein NZL95_05680 [Chitinophagales bacterium]|nr:hypothetical protein [Chitinophagales bacterium]MDW8428024.1 hypothetical protein [Chitinophagales bacterium]